MIITTDELPPWAVAIVARLAFLTRRQPALSRQLATVMAGLGAGIAACGGEAPALSRFLEACLGELEAEATARPDLVAVRTELGVLCGLARHAIAGDCDDRPVIARARDLMNLPGVAGQAALLPGRVVWLAAMVRSLPDEVGGAAVMLVNDLAAVDQTLPLRALQVLQGP